MKIMKRSEIVNIFKQYLDPENKNPIDYDKFTEALEDVIWRFRGPENVYYCLHCKKPDRDVYMVKDEVWLTVMPTKKGFLHMACLQYLLGRDLEVKDFKDVSVNDSIIYLMGKNR